ncbi:MAG: cation transporter [Armatimonadota bacterium]|nr:cation transporter [Armatimonadota bacterium]
MMTTVEIGVLVGAGGLIAFVLWFFFGEKGGPATAPPSGKAGHGARAELAISGMTCAACVARVEKAAKRVPGVAEAQVNLLVHRDAFTFDPAQTTPGAIAAAIERIGYDAAPVTEEDAPKNEAEETRLAQQFWAAAILTVPVLLGSMGIGIANPWLQLALTVPVLFWAGGRFFVGAVKALRGRGADMNTLIALGTGTAFAYSLAVTVHGGGHVYYETADVIVTLINVG